MEQRHGTPAGPAEDFVTGGFEELGWQPLRLAPDPSAALPPVETRFAFAHPRHGVALVDLAPATADDPVQRLRRRLEADGGTGVLPAILHLVLTDEDAWRLSMVLDSALLAAPPAAPPSEGWAERVQRALLPGQPAALTPIPTSPAPPAPSPAVPSPTVPVLAAPNPPAPARPAPAMRPPGGKAPASVIAAPPRRAARHWQRPLLGALGLFALGAAALEFLGPPDPAAPAAVLAAVEAPPRPADAAPAAPQAQVAATPPIPAPGAPVAGGTAPEAAPAQVAALPTPPPPPPARVPPPASAAPPPPPLPDARRVVAEAAQPPPEAAPPRPGRLRIVAHYRLGGRGAAAALTERAVPDSDIELRQVGATPDVAVVRYFAPTDQRAAMQLASRLGGGWAVQDFTHFAPRPSAGTLEVWLPRSLAGG